MTSVLMLVRASPCGGIRAREAIDAALLFSAFTPRLSLLFSGEGVWQLVAGQKPDLIAAVPVATAITAFDDYDIHEVYADAAALRARNIAPERLLAGVRVLDETGVRTLIADSDRVLSF